LQQTGEVQNLQDQTGWLIGAVGVVTLREGIKRMFKRLVLSCVAMIAVSAAATAGDRYYFPSHVFAQPVVYAAPVVAYQPAYVVPTPVVAVQTVPVTTVSYSTHYYAPLVPTVAVYYAARPAVVSPVVYSAPVYSAPVYARPVYAGRRHFRPYRGVEIEFERDGDIEIDYR
jgi:hypothetical protein